MHPSPSPALLRAVVTPPDASAPEATAARELARATGTPVVPQAASVRGVCVHLAHRGLPRGLPPAAAGHDAWIWLRVDAAGDVEIVATHGAFLFSAVRLLCGPLGDLTRGRLEGGLWLPATFGWHRPHWDACYTQYWRSARKFDPEAYVAALAEAGFTHCEVN